MDSTIGQRIAQIRQQIPAYVRLVAVTKTFPPAAVREAYGAGIRDFGENRLQEALPKQAQLADLKDICWHFIGHLQANKAKKALEHFAWIHSVDSLKLIERLNRLTQEALTNETIQHSPQICLQVKILPDPHKYGWSVGELYQDLPKINDCQYLSIRGLMAILPLGLSSSATLAAFEGVRELAADINRQNWPNIHLDQLSMGMSGDYLLAVQAGATMIRLGTIIFGDRI